MTEYIGYHGTDIDSAGKIIEEQSVHYSMGDDEWLGRGAYFFKDPDDANWWCKEKKHLHQEQYAVLEARLLPKNVVDLLGSRRDIETFATFCEQVKNKSARLPNGGLRRNYLSLAIKLMIHERDIKTDMIIAGFDQNRRCWFSKKDSNQKFPLVCAQIQYCVVNLTCVRRIKKYIV